MTTAVQQQAQPEGMTNLLFDRGTLIHLYIGRWTGNRRMTEQDLLLEGVDRSAINVGFKKLMPKEWHETFQGIESQARSLTASLSVEFPIGNARFMFYRTVPEWLRRIQPLKSRWDRAVNDFVANYNTLKEKQLELLDAQARKLVDQELGMMQPGPGKDARRVELRTWLVEQQTKNEELYPKAREIQDRFNFSWRMFRVSPVQGVEQMNTLDQRQLAEVQDTLQRELRSWARTAATEVHRTLGAAARNAADLLGRNGKLNPRSLRPLFEAFESFRAIEFSGNSDFLQTIDSIRQRFLVTAPDGSADYQSSAERVNADTQALSDLLTNLGDLAVEEVAEQAGVRALQRTGEFGRHVDLS